MFAILGILAIACAAGIVLLSDDSSASSFSVSPETEGTDFAKVSSTLRYTINYTLDSSQATYVAVLEDSDGNSKGSVSSSSGTLYSTSHTRTLTLTLPADAGDYTLKVTVTEGADENKVEYVRTAYVRAVDPIKLSVTVNNNGAVARSFVAYFWVEKDTGWERIDGSKQTVDVSANGSKTVTYDYVVRDVSNTTFCLKAADDTVTIGGEIQGLGEDHAHTYYTSANDYRMIEYLCIGVIVILLIVAIWIYRKPIRNFGKPKGRR